MLQALVRSAQARTAKNENGNVDINALDDQSRQFALRLFSIFPQWESFAEPVPRDEADAGAFELKVPQPGTPRVLEINTHKQEITICFGEWHTHLGTFLGLTIGEAADLAVDMVRGIVAEERIVSITYRDGRWSGSSLSYVEAPSTQEANSTTEVYSWFGTHDQVIRNR